MHTQQLLRLSQQSRYMVLATYTTWSPALHTSRLRRCPFARFLVSQHPEVEALIVKELQSLGLLATPQQPRPRLIEHADLGKLTYLGCAIKVRRWSRAAPAGCSKFKRHGLW